MSLYIHAGRWKGCKISSVENELKGYRPTLSRHRICLFDLLLHNTNLQKAGFNLRGAKVCDAFAGTGILGLTALSLGAASLILIEKSPQAYKVLQNNALISTQAQVLQGNFFHHSLPADLDLVFIDPPFEENLWIAALEHLRIAAPQAFIVIERPKNLVIAYPSDINLLLSKTSGTETFDFLCFKSDEKSFLNP